MTTTFVLSYQWLPNLTDLLFNSLHGKNCTLHVFRFGSTENGASGLFGDGEVVDKEGSVLL